MQRSAHMTRQCSALAEMSCMMPLSLPCCVFPGIEMNLNPVAAMLMMAFLVS